MGTQIATGMTSQASARPHKGCGGDGAGICCSLFTPATAFQRHCIDNAAHFSFEYRISYPWAPKFVCNFSDLQSMLRWCCAGPIERSHCESFVLLPQHDFCYVSASR